MPTITFDSKEKFLTSRERYEEMIALLEAGKSKDVIELIEDILDEMDKS